MGALEMDELINLEEDEPEAEENDEEEEKEERLENEVKRKMKLRNQSIAQKSVASSKGGEHMSDYSEEESFDSVDKRKVV